MPSVTRLRHGRDVTIIASSLFRFTVTVQILDFLVVVTSLLKAIPGLPEVSALRAFRVLRPLRSLSRIRGLRMMVKSLLSSLPALGNVGLLLCFAFGIYAILGLAVFQGLTHARCRLTLAPVAIPVSHLQSWSWTGSPNGSDMPWVAAGEMQGVLPRVVTSPLLNGSGLPPGDRAPLFYEMSGRFFSGNGPDDAVYGPAAGPGASPASQLPWDAPSPYYVDYGAATAYIYSIVNNRTAFPFCGAGQLVNPLANGSSGERWPASGIPLSESTWTDETSPWATPRMCVWLIDEDDDRVCSLSGPGMGAYACQIDPSVDEALPLQLQPPSDLAVANATLALRFAPRTCGSSWDSFDNPRFADAGVMSYGSETYALEGGFVSFDSFPSALLLLYQ